jgi:putative transposase
MKDKNQVLTVACKLLVLPEQAVIIDELLATFANACQYVNEVAPPTLTNELAMQSLVYQDVRAKFGLSSQLTIHAVRRVSGNRKTAKKDNKPVKDFAPTSVTYDPRTFTFKEKDWAVSLTTLEGRKVFSMDIGSHQKEQLAGQKPKTATLSKRKDGMYFINIQLESTPPIPDKTSKVLGVDLGRTDIAVTSDGEKFSGKKITEVRNKRASVRASLQRKASKGTRSGRRRTRQLLIRLSGKEHRFQKDTNHKISIHLIRYAKANKQAIALEDLTGIRGRTNLQPRSKKERQLSNSWAFHQLRSFLTYKAIKYGVSLIFVNPAYTSQMCHKCLAIHPVKGESYRKGKNFDCGKCGWSGDADLNGSRNIAALGASVFSPRGSALSCDYLLQDIARATTSPLSAARRESGN